MPLATVSWYLTLGEYMPGPGVVGTNLLSAASLTRAAREKWLPVELLLMGGAMGCTGSSSRMSTGRGRWSVGGALPNGCTETRGLTSLGWYDAGPGVTRECAV
eukprot:CAMPEP_0175877468 /NCGR_PEP_ID=MMETSP0107_2-20121207/40631_1 /TAXON_ID=195067 ORGANISM="Goniomonas pacifica, Strain CCMP1869" /NCGR_SAMPLE_ID=MMETSP0107_2 /ASSEMBLY_ACC=CAM_ASM_000203 /LENGTH=102 /DNA_ID=CAMNT_0017196809 /DNA_START=231 /DNA_END=539 /DNA_ORIENTATION=-